MSKVASRKGGSLADGRKQLLPAVASSWSSSLSVSLFGTRIRSARFRAVQLVEPAKVDDRDSGTQDTRTSERPSLG